MHKFHHAICIAHEFMCFRKHKHKNCATCCNLERNQRKRGQTASSLEYRPAVDQDAVMESIVHLTPMFARSGAQAFARGPLTFSLPALPTPRPGSVNVVQGGPSAGDAETDGHAQHSASKPSTVTDCCMWTAANGHASKSSAMTAARLPTEQAGAHSDSSDLFPWLKWLTVEQLLVCGLLSLRQQKAAASSSTESKRPHAGQPAFDITYLPHWQTAVEQYASEELAAAESTAAPNLKPSAPEASDLGLSQDPQSSKCKRQKLHHAAVEIPLLNAADGTACQCFATTVKTLRTQWQLFVVLEGVLEGAG